MKVLTKDYLDALTYKVLGAAIEVHREMGPGLLESIYETCMVKELSRRGLNSSTQVQIPLSYKGEPLNTDLRCDLLVENCIVVELKAVKKMVPIHEAQALSYARLMKVPKAILINFNCENIFREGQKTFVTTLFNRLPKSA